MAGSGLTRSRRTTAAGAGVLLALVAGLLAAPAHAAPEPPVEAVECPSAVPMSSVVAGMVGEGRTVVTGTQPQPFRVEVLGVLDNGIGPGRDLIMVEVSDLPGHEVVSRGGGIWSGMSGAPVYVGGRLLGAVAYGFTFAPSSIGGLTPAADMLDVLDLGGGAKAEASTRAASTRAAGDVALPAAQRRALASKAGTAAPRGSLSRLVTPFGVSGLGTERIGLLQDQMDEAGRAVRVYAAGSAGSFGAADAPSARPVAGGNFAAVLSSGDLTSFGLGTTTAVCGDRAVAFGHPMTAAGPAGYGAAGADSLAIVEDKTFGSFKLGNLGPSFGTVDQDRLAAVRADLTRTPDGADVTTRIRNADTGRSRKGSTRVYDQASLAGLVAAAALAAQDVVLDEIGDGRARSTWTISGTRAGGRAFTLTRSNVWASKSDVAFDPALDLAYAADRLVHNDYEKVSVESVGYSSTLATSYDQLHLTGLEVSVNGGRYTRPKQLVLPAGAKLRVRVSTAPYRSTRATATTFAMTVPKSARGKTGFLLAIGGTSLAQAENAENEECVLFGEGCDDDGAGSFTRLLRDLAGAPKNNAVRAQLVLEGADGEVAPAATRTIHKHRTVTGLRDIPVAVR